MTQRRFLPVLSTLHAVNDGTVVLLPTLLPVATSLFDIGYVKLGILVAAGYIVNAVIQPLAGRHSDRVEPRSLLAAGIGIMALSMIVIGYAPNYFILLIGAVLLRSGSSFYHPIAASVISRETRPGESVDKRMGFQSAFGDFGSLLIFLCAALLYSFLGWTGPFLIFAAIDLAFAFLAYISLGNVHDRRNDLRSKAQDLQLHNEKESTIPETEARLPRQDNTARQIPISFYFIATFVSGGSYAIILNFANSLLSHEYGSVLFADLLASFWLAAFVLADILTGPLSKRIGRVRFVLVSYTFAAIFIGIFSFSGRDQLVTSLALVGSGFALSFTFPLIYSELASYRFSGNNRGSGTMYGFLFSSQIIGSAVLSFFAGEISDLLGPVYPFVVAAGLLVTIAAMGSLITSRYRKMIQIG